MAELVWGKVGDRYFEAGVDRGVLYTNGGGVAWNGLTAVSESPSAGEIQSYYIDGVKYLSFAASEEFEGTISAFTYPQEFEACDGSEPYIGMSVHQQERQPFDLCYRTRVGNDLDGTSHGYKLHLVYNALVTPGNSDFSALGETPDPTTFSWSFTTTPLAASGIRRTAHITIDSTRTYNSLLLKLDQILYGTSTANPRLPRYDELKALYDLYAMVGYGQGSYGEVPYGGNTKIGI